VKAYVKRNKNDAADAEAICEAVRRPTMRFVQVKSAAQQSQLMLHRTRDLLMRQRTQVKGVHRSTFASGTVRDYSAQVNRSLIRGLKPESHAVVLACGQNRARLS
jgi:transposase